MGLDIMQVAVSVCAASDEHSAGRGRHNANLWGPCSDHARIVQEVFALPEVAAALSLETPVEPPVSDGEAGDGRGHGRDDESGRGADS